MMESISLNDWLTIAAILIAPLSALIIQDFLAKIKESRATKLSIFKTLMATRLSPLSFEHTQALNMIDIEFYGKKKYKKIRSSWRKYLAVRVAFSRLKSPTEADQINFDRDCTNTLIQLLVNMGEALGYDFDETHVEQSVYKPAGHFTEEQFQVFMRANWVDLFSGKSSIPVSIVTDSGKDSRNEKQTDDKQVIVDHENNPKETY